MNTLKQFHRSSCGCTKCRQQKMLSTNLQAYPFKLFDELEKEAFNKDFELDEFLFDPEIEEEFRVDDLPPKAREWFLKEAILWPVAIQEAMKGGVRDLNDLTNIVFFMHHRERLSNGIGKSLQKSEPNFKRLSQEWKAWRSLIKPILEQSSTSVRPEPSGSFTLTAVESPGGGRIKNKAELRKEDMVKVKGYKGRRVPLHRLAAQALKAMIQAARASGVYSPLLDPVSGYRSVARQKKLWQIGLKKHGSAKEARKWIAPPGNSPHHSGRAVDLWMGYGIGKRNASKMRKGIAYKWMVKNAARFGFYPYKREPWHWEYNPPAIGQLEAYSASQYAPEFWQEAETAFEVVEAASLGIAVFQVGQTVATSGDLSVQADVASYVHQNTPVHIPFTRTSVEFKISAHHPRYFIDRQQFYFRLSFEYNGYDLRNVSISVLRNKSSSLHASTFNIRFKATNYSPPNHPVAEILYNIQGRWDPVGRGDVSFDGNLRVKANGSRKGQIVSEENWVTWDGFLKGTQQSTRIAPPSTPGIAPLPASGSKPTVRLGSRGQAVIDLQIRLNRWLASQGRKMLEVDGIFGRRTKSVVITFQRAASLSPDGIVGPQTWSTLTRNW